MNFIFKKTLKVIPLLYSLFLIGCIYGPWDFTKSEREVYRGFWVNAYVIADKPVEQFCMYSVLPLEEEYTNAFAFFDSARITIEGKFSDGVNQIVLSQDNSNPNCFLGPASSKAQRGEIYQLLANVWWDSAGKKVETKVTGAAEVPAVFTISDSAYAPSIALTGVGNFNLSDTASIFQLLFNLPPPARTEFINLITSIDVSKKIDTAEIIQNSVRILDKYKVRYAQFDTLFYLRDQFNTLAHYFKVLEHQGVGGVLFTRTFDTTGSFAANRFDFIGGSTPKAGDVFVPGTRGRMFINPPFESKEGKSIYDSLGFINTYLGIGKNVIRIYGMETGYEKYITSAVEAADDSRIIPTNDVMGASGYFSGGIVDSFTVYVKAEPSTLTFSHLDSQIGYCNDNGWDKKELCRLAYEPICTLKFWKPGYCSVALFQKSFSWNKSIDQSIDTIQQMERQKKEGELDSVKQLEISNSPNNQTSIEIKYEQLKMALDSTLQVDTITINPKNRSKDSTHAVNRLCIQNNYNHPNISCGEAKKQCDETKVTTECHRSLWPFCIDRKWKPDVCKQGLVSYVLEDPNRSKLLKSEASKICQQNPSSFYCITFREEIK